MFSLIDDIIRLFNEISNTYTDLPSWCVVLMFFLGIGTGLTLLPSLFCALGCSCAFFGYTIGYRRKTHTRIINKYDIE